MKFNLILLLLRHFYCPFPLSPTLSPQPSVYYSRLSTKKLQPRYDFPDAYLLFRPKYFKPHPHPEIPVLCPFPTETWFCGLWHFGMKTNEQFHVIHEAITTYIWDNGLTSSKWFCLPEGNNNSTQRNDSSRLGIPGVALGYIGSHLQLGQGKGTPCHPSPSTV